MANCACTHCWLERSSKMHENRVDYCDSGFLLRTLFDFNTFSMNMSKNFFNVFSYLQSTVFKLLRSWPWIFNQPIVLVYFKEKIYLWKCVIVRLNDVFSTSQYSNLWLEIRFEISFEWNRCGYFLVNQTVWRLFGDNVCHITQYWRYTRTIWKNYGIEMKKYNYRRKIFFLFFSGKWQKSDCAK